MEIFLLDSLDGFALSMAAERCTSASIAQFLKCIRRFHAFVADESPPSWAHITRPMVNRFLASLMDRSASYQALHHTAIKKFSAYLQAEEGLAAPLLEGKAPSVHMVPVEFPREDEIRRLLKACSGPRDEAIIRLMAHSGLRLSEAAGLKVADVDVSAAPRVKVLGKGQKVRFVPIPSKTALVLRRYLRQRSESRWGACPSLWLGKCGPLSDRSIYNMVQATGQRAGVTVHPHLLRHHWAHQFRSKGGALDDLVHLAGWSSANMAFRYGASAAGDRAEAAVRSMALGDDL